MDLQQFLNQTEKYIKSVDKIDDIIQYFYDVLYPLGIKFTYENVNNVKLGDFMRFVLSSRDSSKHFNVPLVNQCNGVIIGFRQKSDRFECKLLSRPPNCFRLRFKKPNLKQYDIYKAEDGTTITLYYDNEWILSTKNGYDVRNLTWRGYTYYELFMDALNTTVPSFDFSALNEDVSYTVGFCHYNHHPFRNIKKVWFIYAYDTVNHRVVENPGLPEQEKVECDDYNQLIYNAESAYKRYLRKKSALFGYVLRYKQSSPKILPDLFIESSLMCNIRRVLYQQKYIRDADERRRVKALFSNMDYVILRAFLNDKLNKITYNLFPQYRSRLTELDKEVSDIAKKISINDSSVKPNTLIGDLRDFVYEKLRIRNHGKLDEAIVKDVITSPSSINIYVKYKL